MKEIRDILERVSSFEPGTRAILATVVDVRGSGYRLPGARMLILDSGETFGMVSGGCLEADVLERAKKVLKSGDPEVFTYDTTNVEDSVFTLNMGCRGVVRILLESIGRDDLLVRNLRAVRQDRKPRTMATLIGTSSGSDSKVGGRIHMDRDGGFESDRLPSLLDDSDLLRDECRRFDHADSRYGFFELTSPEGVFEFALESIQPPIALLLFGAGADAIPLARIASELGWDSTVTDHRPAYLNRDRFGKADNLILTDRETPLELPAADSRTVAVVMTHNYEHDRRILPQLLRMNIEYLAVLGPKRRTEQLLAELAENGDSFSEAQLSKIYAPAGLDIGADTPEAIAVSIAAEIQSVLRGREGGHLRRREGSIYDRK